ncbi:MAG: galactosyldiacylglycerol synthase [Acidobacteriia bacterium]|nr:galactosyldiacylglycerol synthase [Terriglobia bacterium]
MISADLIFFDAGGGHRTAAEALRLVMEEQGGWHVRTVNLQELLDSIDLVRRLTGLRLQDLYNLILKKGWTLGTAQTVRALQASIRLLHGKQVRVLEQFWRGSRRDLVVSMVPHFNRALAESLRWAQPATPFVTILTDLADYPPHFWFEPQEQFFICGSERAVAQGREIGIHPGRIFQVSGMILHPRFYQTIACDWRAERERRGLDPDLPTGLVLFGGQGSDAMLEIAKRLDAAQLDLQLIFLCGRNEKLVETLRRRRGRLRSFVEGFTKEVPFYMQLSDFFIGKPGPGSISEAIAMGLPVIVERNAWTLPQERYNADWVLEKQVGLVVRGPHEIPSAVELLLEPANLARFRARTAAIRNRAVYEIPGILRRIVEESSGVAVVEPERSLSEQRA